MSGIPTCDHGVPLLEDCEACEVDFTCWLAARRQPPLVAGGQGRTAASVRASGVWGGLAILALSAGTVVWFLLRWLL